MNTGLANTISISKNLDNGSKDIYITEIDIDSFIKAKGAVFSAIYILMESLDMPIDVLENIYVAGESVLTWISPTAIAPDVARYPSGKIFLYRQQFDAGMLSGPDSQ